METQNAMEREKFEKWKDELKGQEREKAPPIIRERIVRLRMRYIPPSGEAREFRNGTKGTPGPGWTVEGEATNMMEGGMATVGGNISGSTCRCSKERTQTAG